MCGERFSGGTCYSSHLYGHWIIIRKIELELFLSVVTPAIDLIVIRINEKFTL